MGIGAYLALAVAVNAAGGSPSFLAAIAPTILAVFVIPEAVAIAIYVALGRTLSKWRPRKP